MSSPPKTQVLRRRVFYIPGYDPIHPRRYRELYRTEGRDQAQISGYSLDLRARKTESGGFGWHVAADVGGVTTQTDVDVLVWSDIVRTSMDASILGTYAQLIRTAWVYISTGALFRLMRLRKGPVIAALYPVGMLLLQLVLAVVAGWLAYSVLVWAFGFVRADSLAGLPVLHKISGWGVAIVVGLRVLQWFKSKDGKLYAYYLMHDYAFSAATYGKNPPELEGRIKEFTNFISEALRGPYDEVLVVGHSSGAHLGVSILADLIRTRPPEKDAPALGFLSLGQVVPMVSFLPHAERLRADLQFLSQSDALTWVDVTAPGDGCAFALCDPVAVSGVAPANKRWPLVFSAAFTQTLSRKKWNSLKRRFFRLHFQYLCAFDRPKDYDYFLITAGPITLQERYAGRPASKSRIEHAVSKYRSVVS